MENRENNKGGNNNLQGARQQRDGNHGQQALQ